MPENEQALIVRAQAGDDAAFRELVSQYQGRAFGVAHGILGNREDAMDAVQESFIRAFKRLDKFEGQARFYTWFYRILVNCCIDQIRRNKRTDAAEYEDGAGAHHSAGDEATWHTAPDRPDEARSRADLRAQLEAALAELTPNHRAVIVMREVEGLSYKEIARIMDCSMGTVMSRLFHARKKLAQTLEGADGS